MTFSAVHYGTREIEFRTLYPINSLIYKLLKNYYFIIKEKSKTERQINKELSTI